MNTHLKTLVEWKKAKRVRYVGITHYTPRYYDDVMRMLCAHPLDFVQINYSVAEPEAEEKLLPLALERGVAVIVNRPFATGVLLKRLQKKPLPPWTADIACDSWAQILLKFVISHPAVTCAIPATSNVAHLRDNMKAGVGPLPDDKLRSGSPPRPPSFRKRWASSGAVAFFSCLKITKTCVHRCALIFFNHVFISRSVGQKCRRRRNPQSAVETNGIFMLVSLNTSAAFFLFSENRKIDFSNHDASQLDGNAKPRRDEREKFLQAR